MTIPFLNSNYREIDGTTNVVFKNDPKGKTFDTTRCAAIYGANAQMRPSVILKPITPEFSIEYMVNPRLDQDWELDDRVALRNLKQCANTLDCIVQPIIDIRQNPKKIPPGKEVEQNIRDWVDLTQLHFSKIKDLMMIKNMPNDDVAASVYNAHIALGLGAEKVKEKEQADKTKRRTLFVAAAIIFAAATAISSYIVASSKIGF